ncbi:MAG: MFS transporter, partial [bacterium]
GIIISFHIFLVALFQGPFGRLADRYSKIFLVLIGSIVSALALLLTPVARNFWQLLSIACLMGLGGAIGMPSAAAITVEVGKRLGMGVSMGLFNTAMSAGMIVAPLIGGVVMDTLGVKSVFFVAGLISLLGAYVFYHYVRIR